MATISVTKISFFLPRTISVLTTKSKLRYGKSFLSLLRRRAGITQSFLQLNPSKGKIVRWTYYLMFLIICKLLFTVSPGSIVMTKYVKSTSNLCGCSLWVLVVDARCGCSLWVLVVSARCGCSFWMVVVSARCGSSFNFIRSLAPSTCAFGQTLCPNNNNSNNS